MATMYVWATPPIRGKSYYQQELNSETAERAYYKWLDDQVQSEIDRIIALDLEREIIAYGWMDASEFELDCDHLLY